MTHQEQVAFANELFDHLRKLDEITCKPGN